MRNRPTGLTINQTIIWDIADALFDPPPTIDQAYADSMRRAAAAVGNGSDIDITQNSLVVKHPPQSLTAYPWGSTLNPTVPSSADSTQSIDMRNLAMEARNNVFDVIDRVSNFVARAAAADFSPPNNPFAVISSLNQQSAMQVVPGQADQLVSDIGSYVSLMLQESQGTLDLTKTTHQASQLAHISFGLQGFGGNGNTVQSLMTLDPSSNLIRGKNGIDVLAALDFSKRVPKLLFTADYSPDNSSVKGSIIGWMKISDASGYTLVRHSIFENIDKTIDVPNASLSSMHDNLIDYVNTWVLTFYDQVNPDNVCLYLDNSVEEDQYYNYKIQAYQFQNIELGALFDVPTTVSNLSLAQRASVRTQMQAVEGSVNVLVDVVSPYPFLAQVLLGNSQFDWILAGVNVRASANRAEDATTTNGYSYVGSQLAFIFQQMDAGKFVVPKDINSVQQSVTNALAQYGLSQTISELLEETGVLTYFEGTTIRSPVQPFQTLGGIPIDPTKSILLTTVLSAVDPETATLDLATFSANMPALLQGTNPNLINSTTRVTSSTKIQSQTSEIVIPDFTTDSSAQSDVQAVTQLDTSDEAVDLTTFDGISTFMRTIRVFVDYGPERTNAQLNVGPVFNFPGLSTGTAAPVVTQAPPTDNPIVIKKPGGINPNPKAGGEIP